MINVYDSGTLEHNADEKKETTRYLLLLNFNELSLLSFKIFFVFIQEPTYKKDHSSSFPHDTIHDKFKVPCKINYHIDLKVLAYCFS